MRVLLSAYACEPNKGSEPAVGWNWARELSALGHHVWVLTRDNNEKRIKAADTLPNVTFIYVGLPRIFSYFKRGNRGVHLYYLAWQIAAARIAIKLNREVKFQLAHHVTFASARQPSFLGRLGVPFIFGPVAGGESAPWKLRVSYPFRGWARDLMRDLFNMLVRLDPLMHSTFRAASRIYVTSEQTKRLLPSRYHAKCKVKLAVAIESSSVRPVDIDQSSRSCRMIYVGNLQYLKGVHLAIRALAEIRRSKPDATLTIVGDGPERARLLRLTEKLSLHSAVYWRGQISRNEVLEEYPQHDLFLFPSLHDSGGIAVLEALSYGLPVVCLKLGGPASIVDDSCGAAIDTDGKTEDDVVRGMAGAVQKLFTSQVEYGRCSSGAIQRSSSMSWKALAHEIYSELEQ